MAVVWWMWIGGVVFFSSFLPPCIKNHFSTYLGAGCERKRVPYDQRSILLRMHEENSSLTYPY
jgi:hypothetical protein